MNYLHFPFRVVEEEGGWWRNHLPHYALPNLNPNPRPLFLFSHSSQKGRSSEAVCSLLQRHCCCLFLTMLLMCWAESASCVFSTELDFCFKPVFPTEMREPLLGLCLTPMSPPQALDHYFYTSAEYTHRVSGCLCCQKHTVLALTRACLCRFML